MRRDITELSKKGAVRRWGKNIYLSKHIRRNKESWEVAAANFFALIDIISYLLPSSACSESFAKWYSPTDAAESVNSNSDGSHD
jgi:hypothetical protein